MVRPTLTLPKKARLYLRGQIETLFAQGRSLKVYPVRCTYLRVEAESSAVMVSVPKKLFRRAVDRNLLKRRMREAYRLNRPLVAGLGLHIALHYIATEQLPYHTIENAIREILEKLAEKSLGGGA